ncbi:MAG: restriction endonuclease [Ignavibacteria bacterium]|jgi:type II restriction enzyme|nr:restriction endonuclease [Ignavibacteria bacterium]MCU7504610.1 restriction endonuclease [Ignavibacteria bacterium]MCU7517974.1 restriction endonuclease [Ignavibacteria bacterium]
MDTSETIPTNDILQAAIESVNRSRMAFCKFISANDAGKTGGHQSGFYIPKKSSALLFIKPGVKGELKDRMVKIKWQNDFLTDSRFIYYGQKTRDEYRITKFGRGFPFSKDEYVGDLLIINQIEDDFYEAYVISGDEHIDSFLSSFGISPSETNGFIPVKEKRLSAEEKLQSIFNEFIITIDNIFPATSEIAKFARTASLRVNSISVLDKSINPDDQIISWVDTEYKLFKVIESHIYQGNIKKPFATVDELVEFANTVLNRRKSRAGKSLEHHLSEIFRIFNLSFSPQARTELFKKPDFIFPGATQYHLKQFNKDKLVFLAAKTTCKDRWRQILNEADRIPVKHLFTLQQGISKNQLDEMYRHKVILVVPECYRSCFPKEYRNKILNLNSFIRMVDFKQKARVPFQE